jgi:hypothetical protein
MRYKGVALEPIQGLRDRQTHLNSHSHRHLHPDLGFLKLSVIRLTMEYGITPDGSNHSKLLCVHVFVHLIRQILGCPLMDIST